ncbi:MAG: TetR/AcrR family transcriptional regulator [Deltaproteobacteria bacterium]|nr:TetR/AcrR family transcriptional regulator [Deltaproteobacteria bacterium]
MEEQHFPLRERKHAKTKVALTMAFVERLKSARLDDISIKEVCDSVEVSEATFFNYFPTKIDLVYYYQQLAFLKIIWDTQQRAKKDSPLHCIDVMFDVLVQQIKHPYLLYELISIFVGQKVKPKLIDIPLAERLYAFPDCKGIEDVPLFLLEDFLHENLMKAIKEGELPKEVDCNYVLICLMAIIVGVPLAISYENFNALGSYYKQQLSFLWKGLGRKER